MDNVVKYKQKTMVQFFTEMFPIWKKIRLPLAGLMLLAYLPKILSYGYVYATSESPMPLAGIAVIAVGAIISMLLLVFVSAMAYKASVVATEGVTVDWKEVYIAAKHKWWSFFGAKVLIALYVLVGMLVLIVPGIVFGLFYMVTFPVMFYENKNCSESMQHSQMLMRGHCWRGLGYILVFCALLTIPVVIELGIQYLLFGQYFMQILITPFFTYSLGTILLSLFYFDLRGVHQEDPITIV